MKVSSLSSWQWPAQNRVFLLCLGLVLVVLVLDLFYVADTVERPLVSQTSLSVLVLLVLGTTLTLAKYAQDEGKHYGSGRLKDTLHQESQEFAHNLLRECQLECGSMRPSHSTPLPTYPPLTSSPSPVPYLHAYASTPRSQLDPTSQFLEQKGLNSDLRTWTTNIRKWFSKDLLPLILSSHIENCKRLNFLLRRLTMNTGEAWVYEGTFGLPMVQLTYEEEHYSRKASLSEIHDLMTRLNFNYQTDSQMISSFSLRGAQEPTEAHYRVQLMDSYVQRQLLEQYFKVPGFDCREYIITRLHELSQTAALSGYSNNSGGKYKGVPWSPRLPTDSKLLATVFFRMLSAGNNLTNDPQFSLLSEIVREFPESVSDSQELCFYQRSSPCVSESHFEVVVKGEVWPCWSGTENLFCAVAVFLLALRTRHKSTYRHMNCSDLTRLLS